MQDPNADTEWNDVLRNKGIIPPRKEKEVHENDIVQMIDQTVEQRLLTADAKRDLSECTLDDLDLFEDEEDERVLRMYRDKRIAEWKSAQEKSRFGDVREITAVDYKQEVNEAGPGIWVILHLYKPGIPLCSLINQHMQQLSDKFPMVKFLMSLSTNCIPNYPDYNLPTIFVYFDGELTSQLIGPQQFGGMKLTLDELEWKLSETGAIKTTLEENPRPKVHDMMTISLKSQVRDDETDSDGD